MNLCFSFDHRILDGSQATAFLAKVKAHLEAIGPGTPL
jgi:pyruvate/2-oxoglutarate dehydrogenase complex dihydrolipoamide acyltransferase (E2) component